MKGRGGRGIVVFTSMYKRFSFSPRSQHSCSLNNEYM